MLQFCINNWFVVTSDITVLFCPVLHDCTSSRLGMGRQETWSGLEID